MDSTIFRGHLVAASFWHVTDSAKDNNTFVMKAKVVTGAGSVDGSAPLQPPSISWVPVVPSNSIRGRIHRSTFSILAEALMSRGEFITRETYQMCTNGGGIAKGDAGRLTVGELVRARKHVYFGLWGGGPRMIASTVVTCDLLPVCAETLASGQAPEKFRDYAPSYVRTDAQGNSTGESMLATGNMLISSRMFKRNDDMTTLNQSAVKRFGVLGDNAAALVAEYQAGLIADNEVRRAAKDRTEGQDVRTLSAEDQDALRKKDLQNLLTMDVVSPGTVWPIDLRLNAVCSPAQIALFARGVERFFNEDKIGSFARLGFGQFKAYVDITRDGEAIGHIRWDEDKQTHRLVFSEPGYEEALQVALSTATAADLNEFSSLDLGEGPAVKAAGANQTQSVDA